MPMSTLRYWWIPTIRIRNAWKIGLKSQARRLSGSAFGSAGRTTSGVGTGVPVGAAVGPAVGAGEVPGSASSPGRA